MCHVPSLVIGWVGVEWVAKGVEVVSNTLEAGIILFLAQMSGLDLCVKFNYDNNTETWRKMSG